MKNSQKLTKNELAITRMLFHGGSKTKKEIIDTFTGIMEKKQIEQAIDKLEECDYITSRYARNLNLTKDGIYHSILFYKITHKGCMII